jgi:hypothetical protein
MKLALILMTVRVLNPAQVPAKILLDAERAASATFERAGVEIIWVDCGSPGACSSEPGPAEYWLHLLRGRPSLLSRDAFGFAMLTHEPGGDGSYAAMSWPVVRQFADSLKMDPGQVLGAGLAHELGHLLLGSRSHSNAGVMAARLSPTQLVHAARGELGFDDRQAEAIRAAIGQR